MRAAISVAATAPARAPPTPPQHRDVAAAVETTTRVETQAQLLGRGHVHFVQAVRRRSQGRVLAIVAQGDDFDTAFAGAYNGLNQLNYAGITYRRDIGHQVRSGG